MNGIEDSRKIILKEHPVLDHNILEGEDASHDIDEEGWIQHHPIYRSFEGLNASHALKIIRGPIHFLLADHPSLMSIKLIHHLGLEDKPVGARIGIVATESMVSALAARNPGAS